jgi:hypothetical protein
MTGPVRHRAVAAALFAAALAATAYFAICERRDAVPPLPVATTDRGAAFDGSEYWPDDASGPPAATTEDLPGRDVAVEAVFEDGEPVRGVVVEAVALDGPPDPSHATMRYEERRRAKLDAHGRATVYAPPAGRFVVRRAAPRAYHRLQDDAGAFEPDFASEPQADGATRVRLVVASDALRLVVVDTDGRPVVGRTFAAGIRTTLQVTDAAGTLAFRGLPPGETFVEDVDRVPVAARLSHLFWSEPGVLETYRGPPPPDGVLASFGENPPDGEAAAGCDGVLATSPGTTRVVVRRLPATSIRVIDGGGRPRAGVYVSAEASVAGAEGFLRIAAGVTDFNGVAWTVIPLDGRTFARNARPVAVRWTVGRAFGDATGVEVRRDVPPGATRVDCGDVVSAAPAVTAASGIDAPFGRVELRALDVDGTPLPEARIEFRRRGPLPGGVPTDAISFRIGLFMAAHRDMEQDAADENGAMVRRLEPGRYEFRLAGEDPPVVAEVDVGADASTAAVTLRRVPVRELRIEVVAPSDAPPPHDTEVAVVPRAAGGGPLHARRDGRTEAASRPRVFAYVVRAPRDEAVALDVANGDRTLAVLSPPGATVAVVRVEEFVDAAFHVRRGPARRRFVLEILDAAASSSTPLAIRTGDLPPGDGDALFDRLRLPPGDYRAVLRDPGTAGPRGSTPTETVRTFVVRPGVAARVDFAP